AGACVIRETDVPLVPVAALVLLDDAADDDECLPLESSLRAKLDPRHRRRHVAYLTDAFQIEVMSHEHRFAGRAARLHRARPAEDDFGAAVRASRRGGCHVAAGAGASA